VLILFLGLSKTRGRALP